MHQVSATPRHVCFRQSFEFTQFIVKHYISPSSKTCYYNGVNQCHYQSVAVVVLTGSKVCVSTVHGSQALSWSRSHCNRHCTGWAECRQDALHWCSVCLSVCLSVSVGGWWCLRLIVQSVKVILNTRQWQSSVFEWIRQTVLRVNSSTNDRTFSVVFFRSKQFFLSPQLIHLVLTKFGISQPSDGFSPTSLHGGGFWGSFVRDMPVNERLLVYFFL